MLTHVARSIVVVLATLPLLALAAEERNDWAAVPVSARAADGDSWLTPKIERELHDLRYYALPETDFFEVGASKLELAIDELSERSFVALDELLLAELCGTTYRPQKGKKPYLVRAVYGNTPAPFGVIDFKGELFISHCGMREADRALRKTALVVTLPDPPKNVHVAADVVAPHPPH